MDLAIGIILIVLASIFLIFAAILIVGAIVEGFDDEFVGPLVGCSLVGIILMTFGILTTVPASQSYDYVESYITSFHPNEETFVVGMSQGKSYYVLDATSSSLIEKSINSSKLVRDEDTKPYIQKVSEFGSKDVTYYIHVPADCTVFIM